MATRSKAGISPDLVSGLVGWFKADAIAPVADGTALDTWNDSSVSADHLTGTTTTRPLYKTGIINGLPVVRFDGVDDKMVKTSSAIAAALSGTDLPLTYIAVIKKATNNTVDVICSAIAAGDGASAAMHTLQTSAAGVWQSSRVDNTPTTSAPTAATGPDTSPHIISSIFTGTAASFFADGAATSVAGTAQDVGATTLATFRLGAGRNSGNPYDGDIAELLVYSRAITVSERQSLEQYLAAKWGISTPATARTAATTRTIVTERTIAGTLPSNLPGLVGWFSADAITPVADGATIAAWNDRSVSAAHLAQAVEASKPTYRLAAIGTKPALRFDGTDDTMATTVAGLATAFSGADLPFTAFVVLKKPSNAAADCAAAWVNVADTGTVAIHNLNLASGGLTSNRRDDAATLVTVNTAPTLDTAAHIVTWTFPGTTCSIHYDGAATSVAATAQNVTTCTFGIFRVGGGLASGANRFIGDIAEVIVFNRALASWERFAVETYLSAKYGIAVAGATITRTAA